MKIKHIITPLVGILPVSAIANHGFYVGLAPSVIIGDYRASVKTIASGLPTTTDSYKFSKYSGGLQLMLGYSANIQNIYIASELGYMFGNIHDTNKKNAGGGVGIEQTIKARSSGGAWNAAVRLGYQCQNVIPYIRLGLENRQFRLYHSTRGQTVEISSGDRKTAFSPGIGIDYHIARHILLGLETRYTFYSSIQKSGRNREADNRIQFRLKPRVSSTLLSLKYQF